MAETAENLTNHIGMGEEKGDVELQEVPSKLAGNALTRADVENQWFEFEMAGTTVNMKLKSINAFDKETTTHGASLMGRAISRPERTKSQEEIAHEERVARIEDAMPDV